MKKMMSDIREAFVEEFAVTAVARVIEEAFKSTGVSQREAAVRLGVTEASISNIVNATGNPTIKTLARLADFLGCKLQVTLAGNRPAGG